MLYAGLDIHKSFTQAILMSETGEVIKKGKVETSNEGLRNFFGGYTDVKIAIESTGIWQPVYEILESLGYDVRLSHPLKTKAIAYAKIKTDKIDAKVLADLLRAKLLPESYVPSSDVRALRNICRERKSLVCDRTRWKNKLRAELYKMRVEGIRDDLYTRAGKKWLLSLKLPKINRMLSIIEFLDEKIEEIDKTLKEICIPDVKLLTSIPGVGNYSAVLIYSEIGDVNRFSHSEKLSSYAGLVPSTHQSSLHTRHGKITKEGSRYLRWVLTECVQIHVSRYDTQLTRFYRRLVKRVGKQKAVIATARKLTKIIYWMLKNKEPFKG